MKQQRIDWAAVKRRLAQSQEALDRALSPSASELEELYRTRAVALAGRRQREPAPASAWQVLIFTLGAERYAIDFATLVELLPFAGCTPAPGAPAPLLGVGNVHGEIRSIVDLGRLLNLAPGGTGAGYLLLLRDHGRQVALRVDGLDRIRLLTPAELTPPGAGESNLLGLTMDRVRVLKTEAIFAHPLFHADPNGETIA